jgi:hypothetical protein
VEQQPDESAEAEVRDLDAKLPPPPPPADLAGGRLRPAALVRWGFFAGVGLLLAYAAAQALLSVRNLLILVLVAMFLAVSLDPAVRWLTARGLPRGLAVTLILVVLVAILAAFLVSVIPHLVSQFTTLVHTLPSYLAQTTAHMPRAAVLEPEVGFEPTTFRLRVGKPSSSRRCPGRFWLLRSAGSSFECVPDLPCYGRGNDQENDQADPRETRQTMTV